MAMLKILLVDDDDVTRGMYAEVFKKDGFDVSEAIDGVDGLDKATTNIPDVIFTGIIMPRMDGFQLMEALKKNVITSNIPVLMSSHLGREEDQQKADELGAKGFLVKGYYTPNEVVKKVRVLFDSSEYKLKFDPAGLDAPQITKDLHIGNNFKCSSCGGDLILSLKLMDAKSHDFVARFVCSQCGRMQK